MYILIEGRILSEHHIYHVHYREDPDNEGSWQVISGDSGSEIVLKTVTSEQLAKDYITELQDIIVERQEMQYIDIR